jgi:hypothetical protein
LVSNIRVGQEMSQPIIYYRIGPGRACRLVQRRLRRAI